MAKTKKNWIQAGDTYWIKDIQKQHTALPGGIYRLCISQMGYYLQFVENEFTFDYKLYGLENALVDRMLKTFNKTNGNLGALLNGLKGTGKTVTSKIICNKLNLPVIIIDSHIEGGATFLNDIPQDLVIFVDEYEKIYKEDSEMLSVMDGALNSINRRVFLLTTNKLYINENLVQRPGRIRYLKTFKDLSPEVITEIATDVLDDQSFLEPVVRFVSALELITVDIVKAICEEVNIHEEDPEKFENVFNVKKLAGKYDIFIEDEDGKSFPYKTSVNIDRRPDYEEHMVGYGIYADNEYIGEIVEVIDEKTVKTKMWMESSHPEYDFFNHHEETQKKRNPFTLSNGVISEKTSGSVIYGSLSSSNLSSGKIQLIEESSENFETSLVAESPKKTKQKEKKEKPSKLVIRTFSVEKSYMTHRTFKGKFSGNSDSLYM